MSLGKRNYDSKVNRIFYINMSIHKFVSRGFSLEVNFKNIFDFLKVENLGKAPSEKIKFSAVLMKALSLAYSYKAPDGTQPYRRLSGYTPFFPWQRSYQSKTIDISLMLVRKFNGEKNQTLNYRFKEVDKQNIQSLSKELYEIQTFDEDKIPQFRFLKKITRLPLPLFYFIFLVTKIPFFRAKATAPTSISILKNLEGHYYGEHISIFSLGKINQNNYTTNLNWTIDHRLGFGLHFEPFLNHFKKILETPDFLFNNISKHPHE